jgi:GDPmannose 4,6-dehydratase
MKFKIAVVLFGSLGLLGQEVKKALIFGVTGQDGAYLSRFLLEKGYEVHGVKRRSSSFNTQRIDGIYHDKHIKGKSFILHYGDVTDSSMIMNLVNSIKPDEIYNLAAQSHVKVSFDLPEYTANADALGAMRILEAIRNSGLIDKTKFYQASTSEMFGKVQEVPQSETTPFYPRSPYGVAKLYAHWITVNYREAYNIFACSGILFNHESPWRGGTFITKKVVSAAVKIKEGRQSCLYVGNLDSKRDWGYAKDYVEAMWLILQHEKADDWVIATGETHSVREFIELTFKELGMNIAWKGSGLEEVGIDSNTGSTVIKIDEAYFRPTEVDLLLGDPSKAKEKLNWTTRTTFKELIRIMVREELKGSV